MPWRASARFLFGDSTLGSNPAADADRQHQSSCNYMVRTGGTGGSEGLWPDAHALLDDPRRQHVPSAHN